MDTPLTDPTHPEHWRHVAIVLGRHGHRRPAIPVALPQGSGPTPVYSGQCLLMGWSFVDNSGAANQLIFRGGVDITSQIIAASAVAASASDTKWLGPTGVMCPGGLHVLQTGSVLGSVFVLPIH
jgi:hypothetical protein